MSMVYAKPYTQRIKVMCMLTRYLPPKFQQFDEKGSLKQRVAHFVKTCNNAKTFGDQMVKQFVCSLRYNAFNRYTDLEVSSIDSWDQLEWEFLNRFYNTHRTVSMAEITAALSAPKF